MADSTTLKMTFETSTGKKTWSFKYAKPALATQNVKSLGAAMIANGSVYANQPLALTAAKMVTTTEEDYDLT